ncbi:MAG: CMP/dCMP kinase [Bacteroidota bacterium]|nr:CMP/dCMP kinase [Bacteroidota bacterium]
MKIKIAIDGPAGSGKSTTAKFAAEKLKYIYVDTGAMYRAVTLAWLRHGKAYNEESIIRMLDSINIELEQSPNGQRTLLNGEDVSEEIRSPEVTKIVSPVSAIGAVREKMVEQQREIGKNGGIVMDGRDIGTVVFPDAELKIYLVASIEARAKRRQIEYAANGIVIDIAELKNQIESRDNYDSSRSHSPLRKADDAIEIDTSNITIEQQTDLVLYYSQKIINNEQY